MTDWEVDRWPLRDMNYREQSGGATDARPPSAARLIQSIRDAGSAAYSRCGVWLATATAGYRRGAGGADDGGAAVAGGCVEQVSARLRGGGHDQERAARARPQHSVHAPRRRRPPSAVRRAGHSRSRSARDSPALGANFANDFLQQFKFENPISQLFSNTRPMPRGFRSAKTTRRFRFNSASLPSKERAPGPMFTMDESAIELLNYIKVRVQHAKLCRCEVSHGSVATAYNRNSGEKREGSGSVEHAHCMTRRTFRAAEFRAFYCKALAPCLSYAVSHFGDQGRQRFQPAENSKNVLIIVIHRYVLRKRERKKDLGTLNLRFTSFSGSQSGRVTCVKVSHERSEIGSLLNRSWNRNRVETDAKKTGSDRSETQIGIEWDQDHHVYNGILCDNGYNLWNMFTARGGDQGRSRARRGRRQSGCVGALSAARGRSAHPAIAARAPPSLLLLSRRSLLLLLLSVTTSN
ncbi:hypothetical protein EVAR_18964_1 [Eumeta japonica]|uniref:Uncharacterized protein n=1 Tax=Eumeta variegata TaxID=151549 RepID=A0A4C1WXQ3_EUMVA|nr:hypothetical protein EVAR_18964_1 [Eumeta japonica]